MDDYVRKSIIKHHKGTWNDIWNDIMYILVSFVIQSIIVLSSIFIAGWLFGANVAVVVGITTMLLGAYIFNEK
mgnify:CR=1 FL=1